MTTPDPASGHAELLPVSTCPPGMEPLIRTSSIVVQQAVEMFSFGFNSNNTYDVLDADGNRMFLAAEDTSGIIRAFTSGNRPFTIYIIDQFGRECLKIERAFMLNTVEITTTSGIYVGAIVHDWPGPNFTICDSVGQAVLTITGPGAAACCGCDCGEVAYSVCTMQDVEIGLIQKNWGGLAQEMATKADNFGVNFPLEMNVHLKTLMLGAVFLIDFMYFEK